MVKLETGIMERSFKPGSRSKIVFMRDEVTGEIVSYAQWTLPLCDEGEEERNENTEQGKAETKPFEFQMVLTYHFSRECFSGRAVQRLKKKPSC
jgi:hypothetical protein